MLNTSNALTIKFNGKYEEFFQKSGNLLQIVLREPASKMKQQQTIRNVFTYRGLMSICPDKSVDF
jgi:hypothetical protein